MKCSGQSIQTNQSGNSRAGHQENDSDDIFRHSDLQLFLSYADFEGVFKIVAGNDVMLGIDISFAGVSHYESLFMSHEI